MEEQKEVDAYAETAVQSDIDKILRRKRKARGQRACYPCRQRKVKCSYETPCKACVDRDHSDLCRYELPSKRLNIGSATQNLPPTADDGHPPRAEWDRLCAKIDTVERSLRELKRDLRYLGAGDPPPLIERRLSPVDWTSQDPTSTAVEAGAGDPASLAERRLPPVDWTSQEPTSTFAEAGAGDPPFLSERRLPPVGWTSRDVTSTTVDAGARGIHANNDLTGETVHLGGNSVAAMVFALGSGSGEETVRQLLHESVLPLFGLDNESATYPFVDLWGLPHGSSSRIDELCRLLPSDADCLQYFRQYRDTAHVLYPGVVEIRQFESDLTHFLINRSTRAVQVNGEPLTEYDVYGKTLHWVGLLFAALASGCQCSGIPRKERQLTCQVYVCCAYECLRTINYLSRSTLVDIQNLLVLGNVISNNMNAGVAWSLLGLTIRLAQSLGLHLPCPPSAQSADNILKEEVWWRVVWQDSLLSITYDRASSTPTIRHHQTIRPPASDGTSYAECMKELCKIGLDIVRQRSEPQDLEHELLVIIDHRDELAAVMKYALPHLREVRACKSMKDQLEHWNLYLHRSYVTSELYRPTLKHSSPTSELKSHLKATCIESLADTVDAFLGLQNITRFASQSWAAVHRSLSSALLLGILQEPVKNQHVRTLLDKLIAVMSDVSSTLDPSELSAPITRSISALHLLDSQGLESARVERHSSAGLTTKWNGSDPRVSSIVNDASQSTPSASDSSTEGSPYALMENILWGRQRLP